MSRSWQRRPRPSSGRRSRTCRSASSRCSTSASASSAISPTRARSSPWAGAAADRAPIRDRTSSTSKALNFSAWLSMASATMSRSRWPTKARSRWARAWWRWPTRRPTARAGSWSASPRTSCRASTPSTWCARARKPWAARAAAGGPTWRRPADPTARRLRPRLTPLKWRSAAVEASGCALTSAGGPTGTRTLAQGRPRLPRRRGLIVRLFHHARIGAVLGFLVAGLVVGPFGLGLLIPDYPWVGYLTIEDRARVNLFAELGVIFLLFTIGLEVSLAQLWSLRRYVLGLGGLQFLLSAIAIAGVIAAAGHGTGAAIVLGACLAMSSTAVVLQVLEEQGRAGTPLGRVAVSVLLFQDLMVAPVLFVTEAFGRGGEGAALALALVLALLQAVAVVGIIFGAGHYVLRPLLRFAARTGSRDLIMAITLLIVVGTAVATGMAGLSTGLGAFLAGLLLGETEYRHQIEVDLEPFKGLLLGFFFIAVGMTIDSRAVWAHVSLVVFAVTGLLLLKAVVLFAASRTVALPLAIAGETAILLSQAGEFAFVVIGL